MSLRKVVWLFFLWSKHESRGLPTHLLRLSKTPFKIWFQQNAKKVLGFCVCSCVEVYAEFGWEEIKPFARFDCGRMQKKNQKNKKKKKEKAVQGKCKVLKMWFCPTLQCRGSSHVDHTYHIHVFFFFLPYLAPFISKRKLWSLWYFRGNLRSTNAITLLLLMCDECHMTLFVEDEENRSFLEGKNPGKYLWLRKKKIKFFTSQHWNIPN